MLASAITVSYMREDEELLIFMPFKRHSTVVGEVPKATQVSRPLEPTDTVLDSG